MIVRDATVADARGIAEAHAASWRAGYAGIVPDEVLAAIDVDQWTTQRAEWLTAPGPRGCLVAVHEHRVVGFVFFGPLRGDDAAGVAEVYAIYVHPEQWGAGIGPQLLQQAVDRLAGAGWADVRLWVLRDNVRARRFYERNSFTADGIENTWSPRGTPEVVLIELSYARRLAPQRNQEQ